MCADSDSLYRELKPQIEELAEPLFDASKLFVRNRGAFLPHGAVLSSDGTVGLIMAAPDGHERDLVTSSEVLPNLHEALRVAAAREDVSALAVCEDVRINTDGGKETRAIKVLIEHRRGFCVALYMPFRRRLLGYAFDDILAAPANPEVRVWRQTDAVSE